MAMVESMVDQAEGARRIANPKPVQVFAISSGKGGVGKTNISLNLAVAMARNGREVMLLDADLGLANVDVLLGLHTKQNLSHVVSGDASLEEIIVEGPAGVKLVPASSGVQQMAHLTPEQHAGLIQAFSELTTGIDTLIIDTAAGIDNGVVSFLRAAQEVIVVICDEPASITDAYALMKLLSQEHGMRRFHVVPNMVTSVQEGRELYNKMLKVTDRFLDITLDFMGVVPFDDYLKKAVQKQKALVDAYPRSRGALAFKKLAQIADKWPVPKRAAGHLEFFVERLIQSSQQETGSIL
jgi:flagellar biosynthesis protein FlhG